MVTTLQKISDKTVELAKEKYPFSYSASCPEFREPLNIPLQQELQKWLRDEHDIEVFVNTNTRTGEYKYYIQHIKVSDGYESYEDALEVGLQDALGYVKINK